LVLIDYHDYIACPGFPLAPLFYRLLACHILTVGSHIVLELDNSDLSVLTLALEVRDFVALLDQHVEEAELGLGVNFLRV